MERTTLTVTPRSILGKKVKQLRKQGVVPGHIYGYETDPINVGVDSVLLHETFRISGETGLIDLKLDDKTYPVLIADIQRHTLTDDFLNVDFHKVNLKEKVTVTIPIVAVGEAPAVVNSIGILEQPLSEIDIEALPTDLIENIEYNVETAPLNDIDDAIYVKDLVVPSTVTIVNDPEELVFKVGTLITEEMAEALEAEEAAAEAAQEGAESEAGKEETTEKELDDTTNEAEPQAS